MKLRFIFVAALLSVTRLLVSQNPLFIPDTLTGSSINLNLQTGTVSFYPGTTTNTMGANGNLLGPTLILNRYEPVTINVNNQLGEETTIHWHGMHVAPENDGGPHVVIPVGTTWSPSFTVLDWAATYWYHPHLHMKTNEHVQKGIAGMIIVRDNTEAAITLPRNYGADDFPIVVQTKAFDANKQIVIESALDTALMVNGTLRPYLDAPAQVIRLRLLNGSSERYYNFGFSGNRTFYQIASDGGLLTTPVSLTRLMMAPGERAEILVDLSALNGQTINLMSYGSELPNAIYGAGQPGMGMGQTIPNYTLNPLNGNNFNVLTINITNPTANAVTTIPTSMVTHAPWSSAQANTTRTLTFSPVSMGPTAIQGPFLINGVAFNMMTINYQIPFENIEIWQLTNQSPIAHPFHIHNVHFYILDINGVPPAGGLQGRKDVVNVPAGNGVVRFITRFEDFYNDNQPYMYHCHILTHEDGGMMGQYVVSSPCLLTIQTQPVNQSAVAGGQVQFNIAVSDPNATYQWQTDAGFGYQNISNAGQYSGANTNTLTVANVSLTNNNQLFRCVVTAGGCSTTSGFAVLNVSNSVGITNQFDLPKFNIFPNPANHSLFIQADVSEGDNTYTISDISGRALLIGTLTGDTNYINVKDLTPGVYLIKINDFRTQRLVVCM